MIPEKAQGKVNEAKVVAVGPGARGKVSRDRVRSTRTHTLHSMPYTVHLHAPHQTYMCTGMSLVLEFPSNLSRYDYLQCDKPCDHFLCAHRHIVLLCCFPGWRSGPNECGRRRQCTSA